MQVSQPKLRFSGSIVQLSDVNPPPSVSQAISVVHGLNHYQSSGQDRGLWRLRVRLGIPDPPLLSCFVSELLNLSALCSPPLQNGLSYFLVVVHFE